MNINELVRNKPLSLSLFSPGFSSRRVQTTTRKTSRSMCEEANPDGFLNDGLSGNDGHETTKKTLNSSFVFFPLLCDFLQREKDLRHDVGGGNSLYRVVL